MFSKAPTALLINLICVEDKSFLRSPSSAYFVTCDLIRAFSLSMSKRAGLCSPSVKSSALAMGQEIGAVIQLRKITSGEQQSAIAS